MYRPRPSYTGDTAVRQSPPFRRLAAVSLVALATGGCTSLGLPLGASKEFTGSTNAAAPARVASAVDPSDWETVRQALTGMAGSTGGATDVDWRNPVTGSAGTLTAYAPEERSRGLCRDFATTVNDTRGIRRYHGEACSDAGYGGQWQLTGVAPEDGTLR